MRRTARTGGGFPDNGNIAGRQQDGEGIVDPLTVLGPGKRHNQGAGARVTAAFTFGCPTARLVCLTGVRPACGKMTGKNQWE